MFRSFLFYNLNFFAPFMMLIVSTASFAQKTPFEAKGKNYSASYEECMAYYYELQQEYPAIEIVEIGPTDAAYPMHVVLLSSDRRQDVSKWHAKKKAIILINNGIHSGEPDGIDASMLLVRDMAEKLQQGDTSLEHVALAVIPVYNIGGCLNRSPFNRVDQDGPEEFGSRGNGQNLDLNRDFIKCDSREARTFAKLFHWIKPDVFVDNHVSDGADYQHVITMATTQHNKLGGPMGDYLEKIFEPSLFAGMEQHQYPMLPYVNVWGKDASEGWFQFFDSPRFSSGYAALHNVFAFVPETHMLKPYAQRVDATLKFMQVLVEYCQQHRQEIHAIRDSMLSAQLVQTNFPLQWTFNPKISKKINYRGYQYKEMLSEVSGLPYMGYDRADTFSNQIPFFNQAEPSLSVYRPDAYIIPAGWWKVIDLLRLNHVEMVELDKDDSLDIEMYRIVSFESGSKPYEGHHPNSKVKVEKIQGRKYFRKGDFYIPTNQEAVRFIIETLEPEGMDSYFYWNFFDPILEQKEGYTAYAYEKNAAMYLKENPAVRQVLQAAVERDSTLRRSAQAQLDFVYKQSPYPEPAYQIYPVYRVLNSPIGFWQGPKTGNQVIRNKQDE
jgi:hypothetical protein